MKVLYDLRDMLHDCLEEITEKGSLGAGELDAVDKLTHSIKSIDAILYRYGKGEEEEHAKYHGGQHIRGTSYKGRRRKHDNNPTGINQYSREDDREYLVRKMEEMLDTATPEEQRIIRKCIDELDF